MKILKDEGIVDFLKEKNYDIKIYKNARWIDQKCTPDVCSIIADCIINYENSNDDLTFTTRDIWYSEYAETNIENIFKKAGTKSSSTTHEYDKFFQQPMKLFAYAGILDEVKIKGKNTYKIINKDLLFLISLSERHSLRFLQFYITKVLSDSGLLEIFNEFFKNPNNQSLSVLKDEFYDFTVKYTAIGKNTSGKKRPGFTETGRIFTKILNPLAFQRNSLGTERGRISKKIITFDMLMYNRDNFRDIYSEKPKDMARKDFEKLIKFKPDENYYKYQSIKAKRFISIYNLQYRDGLTELLEEDELNVPATQIHHIFPESEFPTISYYYENLIALTPNQHFIRAHPNNKTYLVDKEYQFMCLIAKTDRVEENINSIESETIYDFNKLVYVINIGLNDDTYLDVEEFDYTGLKRKLSASYNG